MHKNHHDEKISPTSAAWRLVGHHKYADEETRRYWRKVWKRNGGRKAKTLRTHRKGK